jgi:UDP-N-acetylglucosamine--N-acetylmuramyl-(pentapeptide) pyrophosphoryl-undecaprenol N-acetylglucosamine transferase
MLSAGGTGGHLFPAEALAEELIARGHKVMIATDKRGHAFKSLGPEVTIHTVPAATLKPGLVSKLVSIFDMAKGIVTALRLLAATKPAAVIGFGGYPSFPGVLAAQLLGIPTVIHEQNAILGKANLWLAPRADRIALSLSGTRGIPTPCIEKCVITGNPVRKDIVRAARTDYPDPTGDDFVILVTGGSQAAAIFSSVVPKALSSLPDVLRRRVKIMQQCKEQDVADVGAFYKSAGIRAETASFFQQMAARLAACHLFIGRSGASTVAEIAAVGRPAVFVPYPGHKDMQQKHNADILAKNSAAWIILQEFLTPESLAHQIQELMESPATLVKAAAQARQSGVTDAASRLADAVLFLKAPRHE